MKNRIMARALVAAGLMASMGAGLWAFDAEGISGAHATGLAASQVTPAAATAATVALPNFTTLVQRYGPAVVNITVTGTTQRTSLDMDSQLDPDDPLAQLFRGLPFGVPRGRIPNQVTHGLGSGFIVSPEGYIMTNAHVVNGATEVTVRLTDRREFRAKVIGIDKRSDIAVIKIEAKNLPVVRLGNASNLQVGEWVLAIGSPYGFENTVTSGIVSAKARALPDSNYTSFIQTDVPVNPGNSGGPLFNMDGEVVGINSQIFSQTGGYQGLSFAIPIDAAIKVRDQLIAHGKVTRGRLGVSIQDVNQQLANSFGLPRPYGALISEVEADGPGASAGLKPGDVITKIDGHEIDRSTELPELVAETHPGTHSQLEVWRGGKPTTMTVTVGELHDGGATAVASGDGEHGRLGLAVRPLDPQERTQVGTNGLLVEEVSGPAQDAGVRPGDVILALNGVAVHSVDQLHSLTGKAGSSVAVLILRHGTKIFVPIELS